MQYFAFVPFVIIFAGIWLSYLGILPAMLGWITSALGVLFGLAVAAIILSTGRFDLWVFAIVAAIPAAVAIPMVVNDLRYPRINDVTTNTNNPPEFVTALNAVPNQGRDMSYPAKYGQIVRKEYPNVRPLILHEPLESALQHVENLAKILSGWVITHHDIETRTLEAEVTTSYFRFVDDVVIRVSDQDGLVRVDMRSKSREGLVDAGENAKRIQNFLEQLDRKKTLRH